MCVKVTQCVRLFTTAWTVAFQAPSSMEFCRQEYWSCSLFPSPGDLYNPGIEPRSPSLQSYALPSEPPGELNKLFTSQFVTCYFCHLIQGPLLYCILSWFFHSSPVHNSTCLSSPVVLTLLCLTYDCGYVFVFEKYIVTLYLILTYSNSIVLWTQFYFLYLLFSPIFNISSSLQFVYLVHCLLLICDI